MAAEVWLGEEGEGTEGLKAWGAHCLGKIPSQPVTNPLVRIPISICCKRRVFAYQAKAQWKK